MKPIKFLTSFAISLFLWLSAEDGFIAHEVGSVVPEAGAGIKDDVNEDGSIKAQGINQAKLVPLLTGSIARSNSSN